MEGQYRYPVYFECPSLDEEKRKKIENYFHIHRKSGGGECGSVTTMRDEVYSVAFKEQEAQQRVLQKCEHVLEFASGPLVLTVRGSLAPCSSSPVSALTPGLSQKQQTFHASTPPPGGEEYELQPDNYLLQYLKECPEAGAELEGELASVSCSAQLYPEEGRVLVKCLSQPAAVDEGNNWKAEVDKLFGAYLCHYEVDPYKVKALLQSCSSPQTTDEVKVYSEGGLAVVVGKHSQVNDRLNFVDSTANNQGSRVLQRKTRICRLGEAKLRLLWKEIEHGLGIYFPGVKVTQGDAGQVVLEGFVEDVLEAGDWVSDKENLILERTVSKMSPYLLVFLRKAYGGPGVLGDFLGVGDKVEIELRDTELHVFSFFADTLDDAEKKLQREFNELKIDVPNCSAVPSDLCEKLKSKVNEMNQVQYRAQVLFVLDNTVSLLGHAKEVEELSEAVTQFILDHSCIEGKVVLRFPELVQHLPQLLQLHKFDYSGVTIHPLTSSSQPTVLLEGPFSKVTEVRNRLGPFLDSLVQGTVTISLPGATRYFESPSGRENILSVAHSQKCLIELQEQPHTAIWNSASGARLSNGGRLGASYSLCDGLEVLVCQGDITKQDADALVNAANEDLDHCGGVAAALSKAGGPEIQRESSALVKQIRKIPTGDVVLTTGGNLPCKKLLHAVGPVAGRADGKERFLLEKTVQSTLNLSEMMEFKSIAMPCISSGVFGVPVTVCAEAIVSAVKKFGSQGGRSLSRIILIDNRAEVVKAMQEACDRLLQGISSVNTTPSEPRGAPAGAPGDGVHVEVVQGTINTEQVDALVSPMAGHDPLSTRVGNILSSMVGPELKTKFYKDAGGASLPGDIVLVEGLWALQFKAVIFINLLPWDNHQNGTAVQVLRQGLRKVLASCEIRGFSSVALPVIGTGAVLRFPHNVAARVLLEEVSIFEQNRMNASSFRVRVVVHPKDKESGKAFQSAQDTLHFRGFTNDVIPDQASFYRYVSVSTDEVTAMLGRVKLQMVHGDIVNEGTDIIVNTTDFSNNQSGVSKAILTAAGHGVQAQLAQVGLPTDYMCTTGAGLLGCKEIIHASFSCDPQLFRKNCKKIVKQCESKGYHSIAFPAINTGVAGMDSVKACKAILDGIAFAIRDLKPNSLSLIRIVILQQPVFQAFRSELENRFGQTVPPHLNLKEKAKQKLKEWEVKYSKTTISAPQDNTFIFSKPQPAVISVICRGSDIIETIKSNLEQILQKQLIDRVVNVSDFSRLDAMQLEAVLAKVRVSGISVERRKRESVKGNRVGSTARAGATDRSGEEDFILSGLKEDILSIIELVNTAVHKGLCQDLQEKKEAMLAHVVQWLIQDIDGTWQKLSLRDNYVLETGHLGNQVSVTAPCGMMVRVNLQLQEATNWKTQVTYKVKRTETGATLKLPTQWEPMHNKVFKRVKLQPNTKEYQDVAQGFHKTAAYNIQKIERVQNLYLWHAYTVCKQRIVAKNGEAELGEKTLYHGTSVESCDCIERDRFDRNFAGKHDLTLTTENGSSFHVHSPILAAVSSLILERLRGKSGEQSDDDKDVGFHRWSVSLGTDVEHVGLQAVVEFAYTGAIFSLDKGTMAQIKAAAQLLGVPRVLDLCNREERMKEDVSTKKDEEKTSALEQMKITLQSIGHLWKNKVGCDVILDVDGALFHVHRVILAASSDYFRGMFTCGMRESRQTCIALPFHFASELEGLIGFSYSGTLSLSWDCVFEITCTALQLQFQSALLLCLDFMRQEMDASSCLDIASFAEAYGMSELLEEASDFVLRNFWEVASTAKFQDLPAEKLLKFLCCDGLCVPSELAVFRAVISWIEADPEDRLSQAGSLMTAVRFPLMTFREFREVRAINLRMECFANKEVELYGSALKEFGFSLPKTQDQCRVRRPKDALVLVGGDQLNPDMGQRMPSRELWFANSLRSGTGLVKEIEWRRLDEIPDKPKFRHGVVSMEGKLYVFGGCYFYAKDNIMKTAYSYDPVQNSWKRLADMQELRSNFSVVVHEERLYAIGGDKELNTNVDSVEMYNPDTDSWSFVHPLDQALSGYAVTAVDGGIFISGGFNCKYVCLVSMLLYHPERGTTYLADMANDRAQHCMEALRGHLYVSGGVCNLRKFYTDQQACEVYDPVTDSWTAFASLPVPHVSAASAVLEEKIYILGGYCQDDYSESGLVHRFDPNTQRWENMGRLPAAVTDIRACLLQLPQHFRQ